MVLNVISTVISLLEDLSEHQDIFQRHLLVFLSKQDIGRLQSVSKCLLSKVNDKDGNCWKILLQRDYNTARSITGTTIGTSVIIDIGNNTKEEETEKELKLKLLEAPVYDGQSRSFDRVCLQKHTKGAYQKWSIWEQQTCGTIQARHMVHSIDLWKRFKHLLRTKNLTNILNSLEPPPGRTFFQQAANTTDIPSSLLAFYAIHAGQSSLTSQSSDRDFFAGLFGSYSCYDAFYSMRLIHVDENFLTARPNPTDLMLGMNLGVPREFLTIKFRSQDNPEGLMCLSSPEGGPGPESLVCQGGMLSYFQSYVERLEWGVYEPCTIHPESPLSRGICLFPELGDGDGDSDSDETRSAVCSRVVTNDIEVRASSRWFPEYGSSPSAMNFGYSIRIRLLPAAAVAADGNDNGDESYQLVERNWEFHYEDGTVNKVSGEGVIGKQPLFFRKRQPNNTISTGFIDLGPGGNGETYHNTVFTYQSQSGPVPSSSSPPLGPLGSQHTENHQIRIRTRTGNLHFPTW